jgi:hypothetical protein
LSSVPLPFTNLRHFVQEKWRIASDKEGSGNTKNIRSIDGVLGDFDAGRGVFASDGDFLAYWRNFGKHDINELAAFRVWMKTASPEEVPPEVIVAVDEATPQLAWSF